MKLDSDIGAIMARLSLATFQVTLADIEGELLIRNKEINSFHLIQLISEIRVGCLLQACAWMASGGIQKWLIYGKGCIDLIVSDLRTMVKTNLAGNDYVKPTWKIDTDTWLYCSAIVTYGIIDIVLSSDNGLVEWVMKNGTSNLHIIPRRIDMGSSNENFNFTIEFFNRELLG